MQSRRACRSQVREFASLRVGESLLVAAARLTTQNADHHWTCCFQSAYKSRHKSLSSCLRPKRNTPTSRTAAFDWLAQNYSAPNRKTDGATRDQSRRQVSQTCNSFLMPEFNGPKSTDDSADKCKTGDDLWKRRSERRKESILRQLQASERARVRWFVRSGGSGFCANGI